jgi:UDP-N-acetylglucosamine 2-epimerase (non-hydrolysing)/GDP/UDP-N,N'-diacetylbacillosamine 2-epimerase (hydrolysing)
MTDRRDNRASAKALRICVVTGSRADFGLLVPLLRLLSNDAAFELTLIATGSHLAPEFGMTVRDIESEGFDIAAKVEVILSSDSGVGIAKSMGLGLIGFADAFASLQPDLVVVLGDRFEIFAAAQAAFVQRLPIAHIAGGDITEGALDDGFRHCITKLAQIHFATNDESARRIRQLGEDANYIFNVGSPGLDQINHLNRLDRARLSEMLGFKFRSRNLLVTFHAATLDPMPVESQIDALLTALAGFDDDTGIIFTMPNADPGGRIIADRIRSFVAVHDHTALFYSLGQLRYLNLLALADVVVGNSSSGLYEAPSLGTPTVNIGDRQKGRLQAKSVFNCPAEPNEIRTAIHAALDHGKLVVENPYFKGDCAALMVAALKAIGDPQALIAKHFVDLGP